ncbi:MAG TPA: DUF2141 domain-containing protein [Bacteroidetes bacterium]|nr:DUF2141 domain-containing protein [Bacteroidota bacterium]
MLNNKIYFLVFSLFIINRAYSQNSLTIKINSLKNDKGFIRLVLFDKNEKILNTVSEKITEKSSTITIDGLSDGSYAFKYFHDKNSNKKLDTNWIGIPKEGYGFSNNAKGTFGPPEFEETIFDIKKDTSLICYPTYLLN